MLALGLLARRGVRYSENVVATVPLDFWLPQCGPAAAVAYIAKGRVAQLAEQLTLNQ